MQSRFCDWRPLTGLEGSRERSAQGSASLLFLTLLMAFLVSAGFAARVGDLINRDAYAQQSLDSATVSAALWYIQRRATNPNNVPSAAQVGQFIENHMRLAYRLSKRQLTFPVGTGPVVLLPDDGTGSPTRLDARIEALETVSGFGAKLAFIGRSPTEKIHGHSTTSLGLPVAMAIGADNSRSMSNAELSRVKSACRSIVNDALVPGDVLSIVTIERTYSRPRNIVVPAQPIRGRSCAVDPSSPRCNLITAINQINQPGGNISTAYGTHLQGALYEAAWQLSAYGKHLPTQAARDQYDQRVAKFIFLGSDMEASHADRNATRRATAIADLANPQGAVGASLGEAPSQVCSLPADNTQSPPFHPTGRAMAIEMADAIFRRGIDIFAACVGPCNHEVGNSGNDRNVIESAFRLALDPRWDGRNSHHNVNLGSSCRQTYSGTPPTPPRPRNVQSVRKFSNFSFLLADITARLREKRAESLLLPAEE